MSGVKVTNERSAGPIPAVESVDGEVDGDNVDWEPGDSGAGELDQWKQPARVATTANITIATALNAGDSIDGVTLVAGDRVLVKDQAAPAGNGIYVAGATPERAVDMDDDDEVLGAVVYVIAGTVNAGTTWAVTNTAATVVDTDAIVWAAFGGGGGGSVDVDEDGSTVVPAATAVDFRHGLDVSTPGGGVARVAVDEAELTHNSLGGLATGDPHTQYRLEADDHSHASSGLQAGTIAHSVLTGLTTGDPHTQYVENVDDIAANITIDGGGSPITSGIKGDVVMPFTGHIREAWLLADQTGSIVIDLWKDTYANYAPTVADTITASAKPTLSAALKSKDTTLTGWTTAFTAGDVIRVNVDSIATVTRVTLVLIVDRS